MANTTKDNIKQYNDEDIYCADSFNMVTETPASNGKIFVTGYRKDLLNDIWVQQWVISKRG